MKTGYRGRIPIAECLRVDDSLRASLRSIGPESVTSKGMADDAERLVAAGLTNQAEVDRILGS